MTEVFSGVYGVEEVIVGYIGGNSKNPAYEQVENGTSGHYHAVMIAYNPIKTSYEKLLYIFWRNIDPTDYRGQFADRGSQYRTAIFYLNKGQKDLAEKSKMELEKSAIFKDKIATEILPAGEFHSAKEEHQDYYRKCPIRYRIYKLYSGRKKFLKDIWGNKKS